MFLAKGPTTAMKEPCGWPTKKGGLQLGLKEAGRRQFLDVKFASLCMLVARQ